MFSKQLAALRKCAGLSQAALAARIHVSPSTIGMYEQGRRRPGIAILAALAEEFGVTVDFLLSGQPLSLQDVSALAACLSNSQALEKKPDQASAETALMNEILQYLAQGNT